MGGVAVRRILCHEDGSGFISCCHDEISQQHEFQGRKGLFLAPNSWLQPFIAGTSQQLGLVGELVKRKPLARTERNVKGRVEMPMG